MVLARRLFPASTGFLFALVLLIGLPARADWLVLGNGERIETQGPWKVEGKVVKFTHANGTLAMLRASEVDLEASRLANQPPPPPPPPSAEPAKKSVLVLTDADVSHREPEVAPPPPSPAPGTAGAQRAAPKATRRIPGPPVVVYTTSWCGYCKKTLRLLAQLGAPYVEKDIEKDPRANAEYRAKGGQGGVPLIDIDGNRIEGFHDGWIREQLARRGGG
ncbi:MAG TPA: glutaredoxin family protein [Thermoanaerobaculia bacterium]|nr:glutaredoxin family protein [Thermoanaerobaculia bacterium]